MIPGAAYALLWWQRTHRPAEGHPEDRRCAFVSGGEIRGAADEGPCAPLAPGSEDWCPGCKFYVCSRHERGLGVFGGHDVTEHLDLPSDWNPDDDE